MPVISTRRDIEFQRFGRRPLTEFLKTSRPTLFEVRLVCAANPETGLEGQRELSIATHE